MSTLSQIFCSSGVFRDVNDACSTLNRCRSLGIRNIELSSGLKSGKRDISNLLLSSKDEFNILIHNYFPAPDEPFVLNLADIDEKIRKRSLLFCEEAIKLSGIAGIPSYSVHAGFVSSLEVNDLGKPYRQTNKVTNKMFVDATHRFYQSIESLLETANTYGVQLLIENNVHATKLHNNSCSSHLLLAEPKSISEFFLHFNHPALGLLLDVAHWRVSATYLEFDPILEMDAISPWIRQLHLSENDGNSDSNQICRNDSWFWEPLAKNVDFPSMPMILEAYGLEDEQVHEQLELINFKCRSEKFQNS